MKSQMGALDIKAAVQECQPLVRGRVTKVIAGKSIISLAIHTAEKGKVWVTARIPGFFYGCADKPEVGLPNPFQAALKKHAEGLKIESITQFGCERAVSIKCAGTEDKVEIIIELFSPGNAVVVKNEKVVTALKRPESKDSRHSTGMEYSLPTAKKSGWDMTPYEIAELLSSSSDASSFVLGKNGLGKLWAKEACLRAGVDFSKPAKGKDAKAVGEAVYLLGSMKADPRKVYEGERITDVTPFPLETYSGSKQEKTAYGEGIKALLAQSREVKSSYAGKIEKTVSILEKQREHMMELEKEVTENSRRGELIYEKYQLVSQIMESLRKARETLSWKEIKARLKDHNIIKGIEESKGDVYLELPEDPR